MSVASICAKVTRDSALTQRDESGGSWGSGYPSGGRKIYTFFKLVFNSNIPDAKTVSWMKNNMDPIFGWSNVVRFSWQTTKDMLDKRSAVNVIWYRLHTIITTLSFLLINAIRAEDRPFDRKSTNKDIEWFGQPICQEF